MTRRATLTFAIALGAASAGAGCNRHDPFAVNRSPGGQPPAAGAAATAGESKPSDLGASDHDVAAAAAAAKDPAPAPLADAPPPSPPGTSAPRPQLRSKVNLHDFVAKGAPVLRAPPPGALLLRPAEDGEGIGVGKPVSAFDTGRRTGRTGAGPRGAMRLDPLEIRGDAPADAERIVRGHMGSLLACYQYFLDTHPAVAGTLDVAITGKPGHTVSVTADGDEHLSPVAACVQHQLARLKFSGGGAFRILTKMVLTTSD